MKGVKRISKAYLTILTTLVSLCLFYGAVAQNSSTAFNLYFEQVGITTAGSNQSREAKNTRKFGISEIGKRRALEKTHSVLNRDLFITGHSIPELKQNDQFKDFGLPITFGSWNIKKTFVPLNHLAPISKVPQAYNYQDLGFFCKLDVQLEKQFKFPVIFRLGEAHMVAKKEGKYD